MKKTLLMMTALVSFMGFEASARTNKHVSGKKSEMKATIQSQAARIKTLEKQNKALQNIARALQTHGDNYKKALQDIQSRAQDAIKASQ